MKPTTQSSLAERFTEWSGLAPETTQPLPRSGSDREYIRFANGEHSALGVYNPDPKENRAWLSFTEHFLAQGIPVPEIYHADEEQHLFLIQDLGHQTLLATLDQKRKEIGQANAFPTEIAALYKQVVRDLPRIQIQAGKDIDYSLCYPRAAFDRRSMHWDLNYFKYYFLKLARIQFDEEALENDFETLMDFLLTADTDHFLFRDFQGRNIMIHEGRPWYIDFQGGRKGALQYDLASLLYQAKAQIPDEMRLELKDEYLNAAQEFGKIDAGQFNAHYFGYVLIRLMQTMGAYGFRGFFERKAHFLLSIPYARKNLAWILENAWPDVALPELRSALEQIVTAKSLDQFEVIQKPGLVISVSSFSYKLGGIPLDMSGNGGGFAFDCRALHNPGRYAPYKKINGRDPKVIEFLQTKSRIDDFFEDATKMVDPAVENYLERGFTNLQVNFGCTGGMHRSVYCADRMVRHLQEKFGLEVDLRHYEQGIHEQIPAK